MNDLLVRAAIVGLPRVAFWAVLGLATVCPLPALAEVATPPGRCVYLETNCPGKGWVRSSCNATDPCGSSSSGSSTNNEAARALGTALGQAMACKLFGQGCPGQADNASARANYYGLSETQRARLVEAIAEQEAESAAAQQRVNAVLEGGSTGGLALRDLDTKQNRAPNQTSAKGNTQVTAWKQLHCAAEIAGFALAALGQRGDYDEFGGLSIEALKSLDGQRPTVKCNDAPPFPDVQGRAVDMEQGKQAQRTILSRAAAIAERMKQRGDQPTVSQAPAQTATETPEDKLSRVQRELNKANREKYTGTTQQEIDQQERDRKELTKLILVNNGLEKGELTNMSVSLDDEAPSRSPKPGAKPVPAP